MRDHRLFIGMGCSSSGWLNIAEWLWLRKHAMIDLNYNLTARVAGGCVGYNEL